MNNDSTKSKAVGIFRCYLLVVCYVLMTVVTTNLFMAKWGLRGEAGGKSYQALVSYQGDRPYVYRMLVPALTGAAANEAQAAMVITANEPAHSLRDNNFMVISS